MLIGGYIGRYILILIGRYINVKREEIKLMKILPPQSIWNILRYTHLKIKNKFMYLTTLPKKNQV